MKPQLRSPACLLGALLLAACPAKPAQPGAPATPAPGPAAAAPGAPAGHVAPIDCPLRKKGIDPGSLKPFEQTEQYIAFLERSDRASWQKPDEVVAALELTGKETVADVGAGSGYFSFRLARALPGGRVAAIDVEPEMVRHLHHTAMQQGVANLEALLAPPEDPSIPGAADLVLICDVLHHVADRPAWLGKAFAQMKPGARLVLIEFKEGELPEGPPESAKISREALLQLARGAGFVLRSERADLLPYQTFLVFERPAAAASPAPRR